jgi:hypothetical protein
MRSDRYAGYGLGEADESFRRAVRDGFRGAGLSHQQFLDALAWYRDNVRPGKDATELSASFHEFATARAWPVEQLVAATSVYDAIQQGGPAAVTMPPTPEEDQATITKANELLAKDSAAYFADEQLQELMLEALERQQAAPSSAAPAPPISDIEIEQRVARQDMARYERMMNEEPRKYWGDPAAQTAYLDAIQRATTSPAPAAPPAAPVPAPVAPAMPSAPAAEPAATAPVPPPLPQGATP